MTMIFDVIPAMLAGSAATAATATAAGVPLSLTAAASGAGAGILGTGLTAGSLLSGATSVASVLTGIAGAMASADSAAAQAASAQADAVTEEAQSFQRQTAMRRELAKVFGETDVSYAAAGIDISAGAADAARQQAERRFSDESMLDRTQSSARVAMHEDRARIYRRMGQRGLALGIGGSILGGLGGMAA